MTNPAVMKEPRTDRDGCDCPPWVAWCAHYEDDHVLYLADREVLKAMHYCIWPRRYGVYVVVLNETRKCGCGCEVLLPLGCDWLPKANTDDFDAALAAFHEAEEQLLRGQA